MGIMYIETTGSFGVGLQRFEAREHGHAHAVARAIQWLSEDVLPKAIEQDHDLHEDRVFPDSGFSREE